MHKSLATDRCATVTVETKNGPVEVNKADYDADPKAYKLAGGAKAATGRKTAKG